MNPEPPTIHDGAGGRPAFERWLGRFYDLVEDDDLLAPVFGGRVSPQHRRDVVTWWCEVMGGPADYTAALGGYENMLATTGPGITAEQRLRFVTLLSRAADDAGLPADPELRAALMGYAEWGTRLAMQNSADGPTSSSTHRCPAGAGVWRPPTGRRAEGRAGRGAIGDPAEAAGAASVQRAAPPRPEDCHARHHPALDRRRPPRRAPPAAPRR